MLQALQTGAGQGAGAGVPQIDGLTPTLDTLPRRLSDFPTLGDALDYAARGTRGLNFFDARANLVRSYSYAELRKDAQNHALRLIASSSGTVAVRPSSSRIRVVSGT